MRFESPLLLLLFIPLALLAFWRIRRRLWTSVKFSDLSRLRQLEDRPTKYWSRLTLLLRIVVLALVILALARPQKILVQNN